MANSAGQVVKNVVSESEAASITYAVGDQVTVNNIDFTCTDTDYCNGEGSQTERTGASRAAAEAEEGWEMAAVSPSSTPSSEQITKYTADGADCVAWNPDYKFIQY